MGNVQGRKHKRRKNRRPKKNDANVSDSFAKTNTFCPFRNNLVFVDRDDGEYVWETHVVGRLPFSEPEEPEIVFHCDKLWQDSDGWSMFVLTDKDEDEFSDVEIIEI